MSGPSAYGVEVYIGEPIQYESERSTLKEIERLLAADTRRAVVFANFTVASRQIDLVVVLEGLVLVIEAKARTGAVRGGANGPWQVRLASGEWQDFQNPYVQTRDAAFAFKDAMSAFCKRSVSYVSAALVFAPGIPRGSRAFQGDRTVSVIGHDGLPAWLGKRGGDAWSDDQWTAFAGHLGLKRVPSVAAACNAELAEAEDRLRRYAAMFCRTYEDSGKLVPFSCGSNEEIVSSADVTSLVCERHGAVLFHGPTGCGKSLLAASSGSAFCRQGGLAFGIQAKEFEGSIRDVLDREAGLLGGPPAARLLKDARLLGKPILFIVDGYNECGEDRRGLLTRAIAALVRRYEAEVLVTSQIALVRGELLDLQKIDVPTPTMETKVAIAEQAGGGKAIAEDIEDLLVAVSTGLEARLVGEVGAVVRRGGSRYALFDAYARNRFGEAASDCIRILSLVAAWLCDRLAFSMSVRDLDRLLDGDGWTPSARQLVVEKELLALREDRVSFSHEMFFEAFAAEAIVRRAKDGPESILRALAAPLHAQRRDLVIGAIDDDCLLEQLLPRLEDYTSVKACLTGRCGRQAQGWAEEHCRELWIRLREEARCARFRMDGDDVKFVEFEKDSLNRWTSCDRAFFALLPELIGDGRYLDEALDAVGVLDRRIDEEWLRLRQEVGIWQGNSRSALFGMGYVHPGRSRGAPGISTVCSNIGNGSFLARGGSFGSRDNVAVERVKRELLGRELSSGQLYLSLHLCRGTGVPASFLTRAIETRWRSAPYHLRLALLDCAGMNSTGDDADRAELIKTLEGLSTGSNLFLATSVVDALQMLGALDEEAREHRTVVQQNVCECLVRPNDCDSQAEAWRIYSSQFDHPLSGAYCEVIAELADCDRKALFEMASKGATDTAFWLGALLLNLASFGDRSVGDNIARWAIPPLEDNRIMPQVDIDAFVVAHVALARLGCSLPEDQSPSDGVSIKALKACGAILYWINRIDLDEDGKLGACGRELDVLAQDARNAATDVIRECEDVSREGWELLPGDAPVVRSIVGRFPGEAAAICRNALLEPEKQVGYFRHLSRFDRDRILAFAIEVLKHYGIGTDRAVLRTYARTTKYGEGAIRALRSIEERLAGSVESTP